MAIIFAVANTKGGVGKTTTAVHFAAWLSYRGKTLLIDTDKQATAGSWSSWRRDNDLSHNPDTVLLLNDMVAKEGRALAKGYDYVVIDAGGKDNQGMRYAMLIADKVIVPMSHSNFDSAAWTDMAEIIEGARINNPNLAVQVFMSRIDTRRRPPQDLRDYLAEQQVSVADTQIPERAAILAATDQGMAVFERRKSSPEAIAFDELFNEIMGDQHG
jgi:chromosome partitioning protein